MLIRYARRKNGEKMGVLVADVISGKVVIGWSKCRMGADKFDSKRGISVAYERVTKGSYRRGVVSVKNDVVDILKDSAAFIPSSMAKDFNAFLESCMRYYKTDDIYVVSDVSSDLIGGEYFTEVEPVDTPSVGVSTFIPPSMANLTDLVAANNGEK